MSQTGTAFTNAAVALIVSHPLAVSMIYTALFIVLPVFAFYLVIRKYLHGPASESVRKTGGAD